jgi:L-ribulose-5-phosphate 4-epimerase
MGLYEELKAKTLKGNKAIPALGLAMFTFGNVSVFDPVLRAVAIKPSGVPYNELTEEKMVVLDLDGKVLEGALRPSSDTPTHLHLYRAFPGIRSIVHTHSTYATSWAQSGRAIPVYGTTHADHCPMEIPCAPVMRQDRIAGQYEKETAYQIIEHFEKLKLDSAHCCMVLIEGHGLLPGEKTRMRLSTTPLSWKNSHGWLFLPKFSREGGNRPCPGTSSKNILPENTALTPITARNDTRVKKGYTIDYE